MFSVDVPLPQVFLREFLRVHPNAFHVSSFCAQFVSTQFSSRQSTKGPAAAEALAKGLLRGISGTAPLPKGCLREFLGLHPNAFHFSTVH